MSVIQMKQLVVVFILTTIQCHAFHVQTPWQRYQAVSSLSRYYDTRDTSLHSTTSQKPLYDGTNYTFPDTTTPAGIAEVLEVSFVHACMQLRSGYVDVLKMFIAAAVSSYQFGFTIDQIQRALSDCPKESANRSLMPEEIELRQTWYSLVYLTLLSINHPTLNKQAVSDSIPSVVRQQYGALVDQVTEIHKADHAVTISVEMLMKDDNVALKALELSEMERAIFMQSIRVAILTLVVVQEALEAGSGTQSPPTPPIKGAFE